MTKLHEFLQELSGVPIPNGDVVRVQLLAKELAMGVHKKLWKTAFGVHYSNYGGGEFETGDENLASYFRNRWDARHIGSHLELLKGHGYIQIVSGGREITQQAFKLLTKSEPYNIFISYRRMDSSALALLALARLKEHGLEPFVDMALQAGGNWHADLEERIKACDYFVILLGKDTLESEVTVKEIRWALQYESPIIPLWHSGFDSNDDRWSRIDKEALDTIQQTNAIIVQDESASGYNTAIVELLNRFGVTP